MPTSSQKVNPRAGARKSAPTVSSGPLEEMEDKVVQIGLRVPEELLTKASLVAHASTAGNLTKLTTNFYEELAAEHVKHVASKSPVFKPRCVNLTGVAGELRGPQVPRRSSPAVVTNIPALSTLKANVTAAAVAAGVNLSRATRQFYVEIVEEYETEFGELVVVEANKSAAGGEIMGGDVLNCFMAVGEDLKQRAMQAARAQGADLSRLTRRYWEQLADKYEAKNPSDASISTFEPLDRIATFEDNKRFLGTGGLTTYAIQVNVALKQRVERACAAAPGADKSVPGLTRQFWLSLVRNFGGPVEALGVRGWQRSRSREAAA